MRPLAPLLLVAAYGTAALRAPPPPYSRAALLRGTAAALGAATAGIGLRAPAHGIPPIDLQQKLQAIDDEAARPAPLVYYTPPSIKGESAPEALALAKHLKARGAKMYGAYWCSHCNSQKQAFGAGGARLIEYVECAEDGYTSQRGMCQKKGIDGYPTWEINGKFVPGERSLADLAQISGFKGWPQPPAAEPGARGVAGGVRALRDGDVLPDML